jgi:hypothetical protein
VFDHGDDGFAPQDIYTMNSDGTELTNVTNHPAPDFEADWGPLADADWASSRIIIGTGGRERAPVPRSASAR